MSNSVYVNAGEDVCASLVAGHVTTSEETARTKPVDLYVERVVAKVTADVDKTAFKLGNGTDWDATKYGTKILLENPVIMMFMLLSMVDWQMRMARLR